MASAPGARSGWDRSPAISRWKSRPSSNCSNTHPRPMGWYQLTNEAEVASPALLLFEERIDSNLRLMLKIAGGPERLRPHVKTHKLGPIVKRQIDLGIKKFKCATI